jgi:hypothetical protein
VEGVVPILDLVLLRICPLNLYLGAVLIWPFGLARALRASAPPREDMFLNRPCCEEHIPSAPLRLFANKIISRRGRRVSQRRRDFKECSGTRRCLPNSNLLKIFAPLRETIGTCFWNTRICEIIKCTVIVIHAFLGKFTVEFIIPAKSVQDRKLQRLHAFGVFCRGFVRWIWAHIWPKLYSAIRIAFAGIIISKSQSCADPLRHE